MRSTAIEHKEGDLHHYQYIQQVNNTCTKLNYTVFSLFQFINIGVCADDCIYVQSYLCYYHEYQLTIRVSLTQTCPPGFNISESEKSCVCEQRLAEYTQQCNITNGLGKITQDSGKQFWVGYEFDGLILHPQCPFDYYVNNTVVFPLNHTDIQCACL